MKQKTILLLILTIVVLVGIILFSTQGGGAVSGGALSLEKAGEGEWTRWGGGKATLIEYSDFQCPACRAYEGILQGMEKDFGKDVTLVYRNYPLPQHQNAQGAAQAAEAAGKQGKFWEMHDLLFLGQDEWSTSTDAPTIFERYAKSLGLNIEQYKKDEPSDAVRKKIKTDLQSGNAAKVSGTPTFYLDGKKMENIASEEDFRARVTKALNEKK